MIAIVPAYLLGRRTHGAGVGAVAVCLVLASPVIVTAWGTDFPDSAAVTGRALAGRDGATNSGRSLQSRNGGCARPAAPSRY